MCIFIIVACNYVVKSQRYTGALTKRMSKHFSVKRACAEPVTFSSALSDSAKRGLSYLKGCQTPATCVP